MRRPYIVMFDTWRQRAVGLLGRRTLHRDVAVWLRPCHSVHSVGMSFDLTIAFLDRQHRLVRVVPRLGPGGWAWCAEAISVLEMRHQADEEPDQRSMRIHTMVTAVAAASSLREAPSGVTHRDAGPKRSDKAR